jgi:3-hydroxymyristoyl/3-hydroxydecanoyl-(acyl carrier protein) dehydratase/REP element-mobilizing transposase RayT
MNDKLEEVKAQIPHREPFLFVDEVLEREEGRIVTQRLIRAEEPHFQGHYPGSPLMPGVLLCEACFQTGAMLLGSAGLRPASGSAGLRPASDEGVPPSSSFLAHKDEVQHSNRGFLPHWDQAGATYFVTFRLADAIPEEARQRLEAARQEIVSTAEQAQRPLSASEHEALDRLYSERMDELLNAGHGACHLSDARCATVVANAIKHFDGDRYVVYAWVVMPNHVHVVFRANPGRELSDIMHSWKSFTAKACNKVLGRTGEFWQREYFDRIIRDRSDFERRVRYTLENPAAAGLVDWKWVGGRAVDGTSTADAGQRPALPDAGRKPVLTRILEAKFRGMVRPGDLLRVEVVQDEKMGDAFVMSGRVDVAGKNVLRVKFIVAMVEVPA